MCKLENLIYIRVAIKYLGRYILHNQKEYRLHKHRGLLFDKVRFLFTRLLGFLNSLREVCDRNNLIPSSIFCVCC